MRRLSFALFAALLASLILSVSVDAGPDAAGLKTLPTSVGDNMATEFRTGTFELQVAFGSQISAQDTSALRPNIDYADAVVRFGYMLDTHLVAPAYSAAMTRSF